ncbi:UdgX family uracil-DNA binding protein [Brucella pseudogrignonensis]|uniref:UdgX family uracil-DNA binding protein n=1 Tax=Brucella pseudogrignonensis TaxID=419475 RepID=UPI003D997423
MTETCFLEGRGDFFEWRSAARQFLLANVEPRDIDWRLQGKRGDLFDQDNKPQIEETDQQSGAVVINVPVAFFRLAEAVICHSHPSRFGLLYTILYRLRSEQHLLDLKSDPDVAAAHRMLKSVSRDYHKMTAFVRFKEMPLPTGVADRRRFVAWFEPDHFIVQKVAPFFQRRFNDMDWLITTPQGTASWDGENLFCSSVPAIKPDIHDDTEQLWRTYYSSIFNPARLKVKMMMTEMPKKYWKNLPEADLIPELIAEAEARVLEMGQKQATHPLPFHDRLQKAAAAIATAPTDQIDSIDTLSKSARYCDRCDLHCRATQTVFGEGPATARVMIVGEQPSDQEDLAGRPFIGPAGRVLDEALTRAGFNRRELYLTNAVKHFKYEPRGKRRIHQRPNTGEIEQCRWWLTQEINIVQPKIIVSMGATALFSLTGQKGRLEDIRGQAIIMDDTRTLFVTVHPSYILRIPDEKKRRNELTRFCNDISEVSLLPS